MAVMMIVQPKHQASTIMILTNKIASDCSLKKLQNIDNTLRSSAYYIKLVKSARYVETEVFMKVAAHISSANIESINRKSPIS